MFPDKRLLSPATRAWLQEAYSTGVIRETNIALSYHFRYDFAQMSLDECVPSAQNRRNADLSNFMLGS